MDNSLILPVYIDTNSLLDILASLEGGFSFVEKVTTTVSQVKSSNLTTNLEGGTEFGVPNVLSLLKVKLGASGGYQKDQNTEKQSQMDRYHTYGSLLHRLREILMSEKLVTQIKPDLSNWQDFDNHDFIEFSGTFTPNPFVHSLDTLLKLIKVVSLVSGIPSSTSKGSIQKPSKTSSAKEIEQITKFLQGILNDHQGENIRKFVITEEGRDFSVVTTLFLEYLRDKTLTEISYKSFTLLGKVVRKVEATSNSEIDLLTGTGLGGIDRTTLLTLFSGLSEIPGTQIPQLKMVIPGPAIEVVPIAIYA
ncbi:MAG: hypothetical protein GX491_07965 [Chloroflexi bacterium]|nr:hypothetical protein [Chloroflexota bacterium]